MAHVAVLGGGPAGLSTALLTSKHGLETTVFDTGESPLREVSIPAYLGYDDVDGSAFLARARSRVGEFGVDFRDERVELVETHGSEFTVSTERQDYAANYVVFACGGDRSLAADVGCDRDADGTLSIDHDCRTSMAHVYAVGSAARDPEADPQTRLLVSVADGAVAGLAIVSAESASVTRAEA
ncbi:hypothetical protein AUR64_04580 [Haloprofundus marisrubri]|uniref:FAD/NAD(P)-binding domain-containing protein n=1 Tax=Haloprofundus marisrubri TaxID=1514971 RepID=A0A0W1RCU0_9EURY|nr:FAD-dependent oxidoreductase [Haloprofundus marisrubri]KTG11208.1 hypothetical protein AUR64_04580 [Haloprofundus marisrubri]